MKSKIQTAAIIGCVTQTTAKLGMNMWTACNRSGT